MRPVLVAALLAVTLFRAAPAAAQRRLPALPDREWTDQHRELAAAHLRGDAATNDFRTLLLHPDLVAGVMPFANYVTRDSALAARHREILVLRTAWLCRSAYLWAKHASLTATKSSISRDDLTRITRGPDAQGWAPFEAALLRVADELHRSSFVSDATWSAVAERL